MVQEFYSNGKLLITGEYLVLDGAKSLALPTKFGQSLKVKANQNSELIYWQSFELDYVDGFCWFESYLFFTEIINFQWDENSNSPKNVLLRILNESHKLNPTVFEDMSIGYHIQTYLTFPLDWGLGTSSTLINNIAQWFQIDAFELLHNSFGGSGYDIACAQNNSAITYKVQNGKPTVNSVAFGSNFSENIYFVYLNRKQNSKSAIESYRLKKQDVTAEIKQISTITESLLDSNLSLNDCKKQLQLHEAILSKILETPTIKETFFTDFEGEIKSLGAWGGDFVMAVCDTNPSTYFKKKGFDVVLSYKEMIL